MEGLERRLERRVRQTKLYRSRTRFDYAVCSYSLTNPCSTFLRRTRTAPRVHVHFTPTSGSWLNLIEVFFGIITRQAIQRGSFDNVKELIATVRAFIDGWNDRCHPFTWTKTTDEIQPHATRKRDLDAGH